MTPILEVDETISELIKMGKASMMKKSLEYLREHANQNDYVVR